MDLTTKTPEELTQLGEEIKAELLRRQNAAVVDREIGDVLDAAISMTGLKLYRVGSLQASIARLEARIAALEA